jgi:hypothetical protein
VRFVQRKRPTAPPRTLVEPAAIDGLRLAEETGAGYAWSEENDVETVTFPWPRPEPVAAPAGFVLRAPATETEAPPPEAPATVPAQPPTPPPAAGHQATDYEEVYDQVVERLRRDLLVERERMGDLLGDLP